MYVEMEEELMKWFQERRKDKFAINFSDIKKGAKELNSNPKFTASFGWFIRFQKRHKITKRISSHIIQKLHANIMENIKNYLADMRIYRSEIEESKKSKKTKSIIF